MAGDDDLKYLKSSDVAGFRERNLPKTCPILGHSDIIPVVDHDHKSGYVRGVISSQGNALLGKIENFFHSRCVCASLDLPTVLRNMASYLEQETKILHPVGVRQLVRRFMSRGKEYQVQMLLSLGIDSSEIEMAKNSKQRSKLYRSVIIVKGNDLEK